MPTQHQFESEPSDEDLLEFVGRWIDLLAADDFAGAYSLTDHDPYYQWSPALMRAVIEGYGLPEREEDEPAHAVTDRRTALGGPPQQEIERDSVTPGAIAEIIHDLPLDGSWSDLTATFRLEEREFGFAVVLQEIHVL